MHTDRVTPIKAGDPIGYLGIYQIPDDDGNAYTRQQMHFELFTPDSEMVDYLLNNPLGLTRGKQYLRLTKGTVLMLPGTEAQTTESYTLRFDHAVPLEGLKTEELGGKTGYRIDMEGRSGYIEKTDNLEIVSQHDGAKLGFQIVREDDPNHDGFLDPESISGVFLEIYKAIDVDGNRRLSVEELVAAKDNPVLKEVWSKLIAYHPTEWRNHNGTARRLSEMLTDPEIPPEDQEYCRNLLPQELVRMQMLSFWDRLNPRLPESSYYFHPVRFVAYFSVEDAANSVSEDGLRFIYRHEAWANVSNRLHWPRGASGVTLGPGYDMKERSITTINRDMQSIGLPPATAAAIAQGAGLTGDQARNFARNNHNLVNLTQNQEIQLLKHIVPQYEAIVRRKITIDLRQHEFDALTSFAYNPGGRFNRVANYINGGKTEEAMKEIKKAITSSGTVMTGLINRRNHEVDLYVNGIY